MVNKPYGCIKYNGECVWNKSKQTIKKNDKDVICESLYLNSKKVKSLRVYRNYAIVLSNELYILAISILLLLKLSNFFNCSIPKEAAISVILKL